MSPAHSCFSVFVHAILPGGNFPPFLNQLRQHLCEEAHLDSRWAHRDHRDKWVIGAAPHLLPDPHWACLCFSLWLFSGPTSLEPSVLQESQGYRENKGPHSYKTCLPTAAEPFIPSRGDPARSTGCDTHMAVHGRLDVIEEVTRVTWEDMHLWVHLPGWWL